ncbi:acyltransferase family protein [Undibacterium sp. Ren11W]|uniref:acyltransferase family protein n=1 Tax=Undibacterium sp. Ren11W TaxID=3413045 RepID=UPI003BF2E4D9
MLTTVSAASFRNDINGLRAWAVLFVILYHFGVPGFGGGFVGVDIFFVISGFLMTGIVVKGLQQGHFSILDFYLARARRILPALLVLCAILLGFGWFLLMPPDYLMLGTHVIASLLFVSNLKYWDEAGYFDLASHDKWLLHTWSLSVEWQFYLILPLLLWGAWRLWPGRRTQIAVLLGALLLSFSASLWVTAFRPSMAFYLLHTRAWEMLAGGLVLLASARPNLTGSMARWLQALAFGLILASVALFDKAAAWPGYRACVPVLGAMLILWLNHASLWTSSRAAQWLGDRSYSLYLWHWPVCVALVYAELNSDSLATLAGILLTLLLGHFSYLLVENPARKVLSRKRVMPAIVGLTLAGICVLLPAMLVRMQTGLAGRFASQIELAAAEANNTNPRRNQCHAHQGVESPSCVYGGQKWKLILAGDSHAGAIVTALAQAQPDVGAGVVQWTYSGCAFVPGMQLMPDASNLGKDYQCSGFINWATARMQSLPRSVPLLIVNRYPEYPGATQLKPEAPPMFFSKVYASMTSEFFKEFADAIRNTSCELAQGRQVYLMRPIPEMGVDVPRLQSRRMAFGLDTDISISLKDYHARNEWVWAAQDAAHAQCGVQILDPLPYLCHDGRCYGSKDGRPLYHDDNHLSEYGNKLLLPMFAQVFRAQ